MTSRFQLSLRVTVTLLVLAIVPNLVITNSAQAQTENKTRLSFEIKDVHQYLTGQSQKSEPETTEPVIDPNIAILQNYLAQKGSPLAPFASDILKHQNWKLVLAISNGESTMCKRQLYNNCWGVGGAWNLRRYGSFIEGFADVNRFLGEKYILKGADTPEKIVNKYVGHSNRNWVLAVNQVLTQINQLPLVN